MTLLRAGPLALVLIVLAAPPMAAQGRTRVLEWGVHATLSDVVGGEFGMVVGPRGALRTLANTRVALSLGAGIVGDRVSGRGDAAIEYLLRPRAAGRLGVYAGGGLTGMVGGGSGGYLLLYVGVERSPGLPSGWAVEAGLGRGFRVRAAYHWRKFPAGWRREQ